MQLEQVEVDARQNLLFDVKDVITSKWDGAVMQPFGSYPVGLSIFLSDIDVSILGMGVDDDKNNQRRLSIECSTSLNTTLNTKKQKIQFTGATIDLTDADQAGQECSSEAISSRTSKASHSSSTNKQQQSVISIDDSDEDAEEVISWSLDTFSASNAAVLVTDTDDTGNRIESTVDVPSVSTATSLNALKLSTTSELPEVAHTAEQKQGQEQVETQGDSVNNVTTASATKIEIASAALPLKECAVLEAPNDIREGPFSSSSVVSNGVGAEAGAGEGAGDGEGDGEGDGAGSGSGEGEGEGDVLQSLHTGDGSIISATGRDEEKKSELKEEDEVAVISGKKLFGGKRERECDDDDDDKGEGEGEDERSDEGRYLGEDAFDDFDGKDDYSEDDDDDASGDSSYRRDDDEEEDDYDYDDYDDEDNFIMKDEEQRGEIKGRKSLRISSAKKSSGQLIDNSISYGVVWCGVQCSDALCCAILCCTMLYTFVYSNHECLSSSGSRFFVNIACTNLTLFSRPIHSYMHFHVHTHTHTQSFSLSLILSNIHPLKYLYTHIHTYTHTITLPNSHLFSLFLSHSHTQTHTHTHALSHLNTASNQHVRLDVDEDDIDDFSNTEMHLDEDIDVHFNLQDPSLEILDSDSNRKSRDPYRDLAGIAGEAVRERDMGILSSYSNSYLSELSESTSKTQEFL